MDGAGPGGAAVLDEAMVRTWMALAEESLRRLAPRIDALNVFPVADADTGTNVLLTVAAGTLALEQGPATSSAAEALDRLATGALISARGSSGVILGAWLRGLADGLADDGTPPGPERLVAALGAAAARAAGSVLHPSPGTVLDTAAQVAEAARSELDAAGTEAPAVGHARADGDRARVVRLLRAATDSGLDGLQRTSVRHPVLAAAGVVDSGACALLVLLEALVVALDGRSGDRVGAWVPDSPSRPAVPGSGGQYEVMAWSGGALDPQLVAGELDGLGDAVAVSGGAGGRRSHVHTDDPAAVLAVAGRDGLRHAVLRSVHGPQRPAAVVVCAEPALAAWFAAAGAVVLLPGAAVSADLGGLCREVGGPGAVVLATDPACARASGACTADPVRAAVALAAVATAGERPDRAVGAALTRLRSVEVGTDAELEAALDRLLSGVEGEVLTAAPSTQARPERLVTLVRARRPLLEVVLLAATAGGPAWQLGLD